MWICKFLFWTAHVGAHTNKSKRLYFKTECGVSNHHLTWMNTHILYVQSTLSKLLIRWCGTLELTFHMSIFWSYAYMRFFCICGYPHICIHYADFNEKSSHACCLSWDRGRAEGDGKCRTLRWFAMTWDDLISKLGWKTYETLGHTLYVVLVRLTWGHKFCTSSWQ